MSNIAISVEQLSKQYVLGLEPTKRSLREALSDGARNLLRPNRSTPKDSFWALKNLTFDIEEGDRVGIIGRNGAGKSTLLKILSRITEPTSGRIRINGRVASLLEVGTGFHPELTGRENIYLNGAVLGMSKFEIERKFDEIVAFSEVEKFLDTPVKRYSSGMYVRLAFAVAAHLEPEILIVDEVLAVGDAQFQKKCLGKLKDASSSGRTVIFVSHQMATVTSLCNKVVWLSGGQIKMEGEVAPVTSSYLLEGSDSSGQKVFPERQDAVFQFHRLSLMNKELQVSAIFDVQKPIVVGLDYSAQKSFNNLEISVRVYNASGIPIFTTNRSSKLSCKLHAGTHRAFLEIAPSLLTPGSYTIDIAAHIPNTEVLENFQSALSFEIEETGSSMSLYQNLSYGVVLVDFPWEESSVVLAHK
jgi:lipopolysaccharide transport system ATP-binding protein